MILIIFKEAQCATVLCRGKNYDKYYMVWIFKGLDGVKVTQILTQWNLKFEQICFMFHVTGFAICFWHTKNAEENLYNSLKEKSKEGNKLALKNKGWIIHMASAK